MAEEIYTNQYYDANTQTWHPQSGTLAQLSQIAQTNPSSQYTLPVPGDVIDTSNPRTASKEDIAAVVKSLSGPVTPVWQGQINRAGPVDTTPATPSVNTLIGPSLPSQSNVSKVIPPTPEPSDYASPQSSKIFAAFQANPTNDMTIRENLQINQRQFDNFGVPVFDLDLRPKLNSMPMVRGIRL